MNPLALIYGKQKLSQTEIDDLELALLTMVDSLKADKISEDQFEAVVTFVLTAQYLAGCIKDRRYYDATRAAMLALVKSGELKNERKTEYLTPSTTQKRQILEVLTKLPTIFRGISRGHVIGSLLGFLEWRSAFPDLTGAPLGVVTRMTTK